MDDSGAVSETGGGGQAGATGTDSRHTSTNSSNKMKCWTDVIDDEVDGEDVFKEQSFIASLSKERKLRSSQKILSTGSSENLTSGYSTSSMNGSGECKQKSFVKALLSLTRLFKIQIQKEI